jgi:hypothetical protein
MNATRLRCLRIANETRLRRSALRRDLASGEIGAADLFLGSWPCIDRAMVGVVLSWLPSIGPVCVDRICEDAGVHYGHPFARLTQRQRRVLVDVIAKRRPAVLAA